jgi:hypothetical protein
VLKWLVLYTAEALALLAWQLAMEPSLGEYAVGAPSRSGCPIDDWLLLIGLFTLAAAERCRLRTRRPDGFSKTSHAALPIPEPRTA